MTGIEISFDPARIDRERVHRWLAEESYWARGIVRSAFDRSIEHCLVAGAYADGAQIGFARAITDHATFAYLCDVFVDTAHRGQGIGGALVAAIIELPALHGLRRIALRTSDAHALYARFGFTPLATPELWMERYNSDFLKQQASR
ncbi:MAG: GNAT family N-acetyltransferase [Betaproteobacteria bacterium]